MEEEKELWKEKMKLWREDKWQTGNYHYNTQQNYTLKLNGKNWQKK